MEMILLKKGGQVKSINKANLTKITYLKAQGYQLAEMQEKEVKGKKVKQLVIINEGDKAIIDSLKAEIKTLKAEKPADLSKDLKKANDKVADLETKLANAGVEIADLKKSLKEKPADKAAK